MAPFRPALLVVDMQEDFCPPDGSLAVAGGRDIAHAINMLLALPFHTRIATQDWHPADHVSFAANHPAPNNKPFESVIRVANPLNAAESEQVRLWPVHCVQGSRGAELIPEVDMARVDHVVKKGQDSRVEMFSAFRDTYVSPCVSESDLARLLKEAGTTHVYVVGLAADFCVKFSAIHAAQEGYTTYIVEEGTKAVDQSEEGMKALKDELKAKNVVFVSSSGPEVKAVAASS